jgi:CMP-N,N'-diacetyllegionaminic acid synthase
MLKDCTVISLIPAKKKSTRLKNKNLLKINGISLLVRAIICSLKSKYIEHTFLSSDSEKMLSIGKKYCLTPIIRPKQFATKKSLANEVIYHAYKVIKKKIKNPNKIICVYLQPTSPFRNYKHVDTALKLFVKNKAKVLISVEESHKSIYKTIKIKKNKILTLFKKSYLYNNNQSFEKTYNPNGAIYIFRYKDFMKNKSIPIENALPYIMSRKDSLDIDDYFDYKIAKLISLRGE